MGTGVQKVGEPGALISEGRERYHPAQRLNSPLAFALLVP